MITGEVKIGIFSSAVNLQGHIDFTRHGMIVLSDLPLVTTKQPNSQ